MTVKVISEGHEPLLVTTAVDASLLLNGCAAAESFPSLESTAAAYLWMNRWTWFAQG